MLSVETTEGDSDIYAFREEQYLRARDYHLKLEIQIPELEAPQNKDSQRSQPMVTYKSSEKENYSKNVLNTNLNASYMKAKRPVDTELTTEYTFSPSIHPGSKSIERGVDHLYRWKEIVEKKKEMHRELKNVIEESDVEKRVYTNKKSEEIIANSRPALRIEDSLIVRDQKRKEKLKRLEESMYDRQNIPEISERASRFKPKADLLTRLYHQPLQKMLDTTQSSSRSLTPSFRMETKKRAFSPFRSPVGYASGSDKRRPQTTKTVKNEHNLTSERVFQHRDAPEKEQKQKMSSISHRLTKKVLPFGQDGSNDSDACEKSGQQSQSDASLTTKRIAPNFQGDKSNLPNMLFFGSQKDPLQEKLSAYEKSIVKQDFKTAEIADGISSGQSQAENFIKQFDNDMSSVSRDSSQVLRIQKAKGSGENKNLANHNLHERNQLWLQQKDKRIATKQEEKRTKELEGCTFQPAVSKKPAPKRHELTLVPNFKSQIIVQMPSPSQIAVRRIISPAPKPKAEQEEVIVKQRTSSPKSLKETSSKSQVQLAPRAVNVKIHIDENRNHFNIYNVNQPGSPQKTIYNDLEKQKKLINYILDSEKFKAKPQSSNA